ncbi:hypothetical protein ABPG75_009649 [Micractinium tetrahymenae]
MAASTGGLAALRQRAGFPSAQLKATVDGLLARAADPPSAPLEMITLLRRLVSQLGRIDTETMVQLVTAGPAAGTPHAAAALYFSVLRAIATLVQQPACAAMLESECTASHSTALHLLEVLLAQMMSCGPRAMAPSADCTEEVLQAPRCGLWAAAKAVLRAAPNAGLAALLALSAKRGSVLLVSTLLNKDNRAMQAAINALLGAALRFVASQAPLLAGRLQPALLAAPLNSRLEDLSRATEDESGHRMWVPVRTGLEAIAAELVRAGGPPLYGAFRAALPPYPPDGRPRLLALMNDEWEAMRQRRQNESLEQRLHRTLAKCGQLDTEAAGLAELHDFLVEHGAFGSIFLARAGGKDSPYVRLVGGLMKAAVHAREPVQHRTAAAGQAATADAGQDGAKAAGQAAHEAKVRADTATKEEAEEAREAQAVPLAPLSTNAPRQLPAVGMPSGPAGAKPCIPQQREPVGADEATQSAGAPGLPAAAAAQAAAVALKTDCPAGSPENRQAAQCQPSRLRLPTSWQR